MNYFGIHVADEVGESVPDVVMDLSANVADRNVTDSTNDLGSDAGSVFDFDGNSPDGVFDSDGNVVDGLNDLGETCAEHVNDFGGNTADSVNYFGGYNADGVYYLDGNVGDDSKDSVGKLPDTDSANACPGMLSI